MALSKSDKEEIEVLFQKAVGAGENKGKDKYKQTQKRLYAYPILKRNIERYRLDIEDIRQEDIGKSKDIVLYQTGGGSPEPLDLEELRAAKILIIKQKIARDEKEIVEIEAALKEVEGDEYFSCIPLHYFKKEKTEVISKRMSCDKVTIWRHKKRLVATILICLHGADAL